MSKYDSGLEPLEEKTLAEDQKLTVQDRATQEVTAFGGGLDFMLMADTGATVPAWWSMTRDRFLSKDWLRCPLFSGAVFNVGAKLATIPAIIEPRDPRIKAQRDLAEQYQQTIYEGAEFGRGWLELAMKWYQDRWVVDNGAFLEVLGYGPKDGPIKGRAVGLSNLDSQRCSRTGNPEYPVVYTRIDGRRYKLHYTRVIYASQLPSARDEMHGVGLSWYSRCVMTAQSIVDDLTFKQEKLGKRQARAILIGKKMTVDVVKAAFQMADEAADSAGLTRMNMFPIIANPNAADVGIDMVNLAELPDGFEWSSDVNIAMYIIALTGGFPVRWMWPATVVGATKADAMIQHMATAMSGTAHELGTLALALGGSERGMTHQTGKFLPPTLKIRFDVQDDWIDEVQAGIHNVRAQSYERNIADGAITIRVTREQMLGTGEITEAQFREMELESGRTQDGLPVDSLFYSDNPYLRGIDPEDWSEEEVKARLVKAKKAVVQDQVGIRKEEAREAVAALEWLLKEEEAEAEEAQQQQSPQRPAAPRSDTEGQTETPETETEGQSEEAKGLTIVKGRAGWERQMAADIEQLFGTWEEDALDALEKEEQPDYDKWKAALVALLVGLLAKAYIDGMDDRSLRHGDAVEQEPTFLRRPVVADADVGVHDVEAAVVVAILVRFVHGNHDGTRRRNHGLVDIGQEVCLPTPVL